MDFGLSEEEWGLLTKFRKRVAEWMPTYCDDVFLLRWLIARNWNLTAAEHMLSEHLKWRKRWKVDDLEGWKMPEVLVKYYPYGVCGFDKEGSPIVVVPFAGLDIVGMLHSVTKADFVRCTIKSLEKVLKLADKQSEKHGLKARKLVVIMDMEGFALKPYTWRPAAELIVTLVRMYEANYPEILKIAFIVNAPMIFSVGFALIKNFLNEHTIHKIHIYKSDQKKWLPHILEKINENQLPVHFGGTMVDENGDPKCSSTICQGGKIPKSYYNEINETEMLVELEKKVYAISHVRKGARLCFDYIAPKPGYILKWEFHTESHDINFGVVRLDMRGNEIEEIPMRRVKCNTEDEIGFLTTDWRAKYRIIFDNTYSFIRGSKIQNSYDSDSWESVENETNSKQARPAIRRTGGCVAFAKKQCVLRARNTPLLPNVLK